MAVKARRIVRLLTGLTFRELAKGRLAAAITPVYATLPW